MKVFCFIKKLKQKVRTKKKQATKTFKSSGSLSQKALTTALIREGC